jgi:branched-chain amino acid transport system permease protein
MRNALALLATLAAVTVPLIAPGYAVYVVTLGLIFGVAAVGLNLLTGQTGQVSIGHAGFMGIGAYASALLSLRLGWPLVASIPLAGLAAAVVGFALGVPALRLSGPYLAVATLGFGTFVSQLLVKWESLTGGYMGLKPPRLSWAPGLPEDWQLYYATLAALGALGWLALRVERGRLGRAMAAVRDAEWVAEASGIDPVRVKLLAFGLSAGYAGLAGALQAHVVGFISPSDFSLHTSIFLLSAVVIGGLASVPGAVTGAVVLTVGFQALSGVRDLRTVIYGAAMVLAVMFFPGGLWRLRLTLAGLSGRKAVVLPPKEGVRVGDS